MMIALLRRFPLLPTILFLGVHLTVLPAPALGHETGQSHLHFQKPQIGPGGSAPGASSRSPADASLPAPAAPLLAAARPLPRKTRPQTQRAATPVRASVGGSKAVRAASPRPDSGQVSTAPAELPEEPILDGEVSPAYYSPGRRTIVPRFLDGHATPLGSCIGCETGYDPGCGVAEPDCGLMEPACGVADPGCGFAEPACGVAEPVCSVAEPGCGIAEPGCGIVEPGCEFVEAGCGVAEGCDGVDCGSCVGRSGADYWCFPVCLPRFKELNVWGGVHGFKGPRDSTAFGGPNDGNFGFQEGVILGGRAPLIGLMFPQLGYQVGYQAVQSQMHGNSADSTLDRNQQFVTVGLFRRVPTGLQLGAAWDYQRDDFNAPIDLSQIRYEVSLKGRSGREIGFWGASAVDEEVVGGRTLETVEQYAGFLRWTARDGGAIRFWFGGTNDSETLFGGDFYAPIGNRWSVNSGFNYLITDAANGELGAQEESWNVGINLVWHFGATAKKVRYNPFAPLFSVADNGWMFVDERP